MIQQNWWSVQLAEGNKPLPPLRQHLKADVVIVGAGMAGISAATGFINKGLKVIILEKNIFGGSSTGKSAGFLTPDSELELWQLIRQFGKKKASKLWNAATAGIDLIADNIRKYQIDCDLELQDSLFLGNGKAGKADVSKELKARKSLDLDQTLLDEKTLGSVIGSNSYSMGLQYQQTYVINPLLYCCGMKKALLERGVEIYESSEVINIKGHIVQTQLGSVTAGEIIFCADKLSKELNPFSKEVYHAQTFLAISDPLDEITIQKMFPNGKCQCWDTDLVYTYFRLTKDNRILLGGSNKLTTFSSKEANGPAVISKVILKFKAKFPYLKELEFIEFWPGRIDTTRDLLPIAATDEKMPWVHFVLGCAGLPWASFCGSLVARHVLKESTKNDLEIYRYFKPHRNTFFSYWIERLIGKQLSFSINSVWSKYYRSKR